MSKASDGKKLAQSQNESLHPNWHATRKPNAKALKPTQTQS